MLETEKVVEKDEVVVAEQPGNPHEVPELKEPQKEGLGAKVKEFFRKKVVSIKRKPQKLAFIFLAIVSIYNLITLSSFSQAIIRNAKDVEWVGLMVFVTTLFSILILVSYLNAFPKLKKPGSKVVVTMTEGGVKLNINILMVVVVVFMALAMIACDIVYYKLMNPFYVKEFVDKGLANDAAGKLINSTFSMSIAHIVLLGIFLVLLLTLPLYRKLIMKINTSKVVESNDINEVIDTED